MQRSEKIKALKSKINSLKADIAVFGAVRPDVLLLADLEDELKVLESSRYGVAGICKKCKEHTEWGNSCCGDEYVHID